MRNLWKKFCWWWLYPAETGRVVDFRVRSWGHNIDSDGAVWCSPRLQKGDVVVTKSGRFLTVTVRPCYDPPDMVFATWVNLARKPK